MPLLFNYLKIPYCQDECHVVKKLNITYREFQNYTPQKPFKTDFLSFVKCPNKAVDIKLFATIILS